jgi:hypothetical protein
MLPAVKKLPFEELFRHKTVNAAPKRAGEREEEEEEGRKAVHGNYL